MKGIRQEFENIRNIRTPRKKDLKPTGKKRKSMKYEL